MAKQRLTKDQNSCIVLFISICYIFTVLFLYCGSEELYKLKTLIIRHCQINSIDLISVRNNYIPRWNITIVYKNETNDDILIASFGTKSDKWAWIKARKYQINETYSCYHSRNETSIIQWGWQWNQPNKLKVFAFLFSGMILFIIATGLIIFKRRFEIELQNTQQKQIKTLLTSGEHQQTIASSQIPLLRYDK